MQEVQRLRGAQITNPPETQRLGAKQTATLGGQPAPTTATDRNIIHTKVWTPPSFLRRRDGGSSWQRTRAYGNPAYA